MKGTIVAIGLAFAWSAPTPCFGQGNLEPTVVRLKVTPMDVPDPALKYRLVPDSSTVSPGNGALGYYRAIVLAKTAVDAAKRDELVAKSFDNDAPPIDEQQRRQIVAAAEPTLKELRRAARRTHCDWELPLKEEGFFLTLAEFQESRSLARLLAFKASGEIAEGRFGDAAESLQTGFAMARDVGKAPLLISGLIGLAEGTICINRVEQWISRSDSPNLYWAIADIPRPFIDGSKAIETELQTIRYMFPEVFGDHDALTSPEQWQSKLNAAIKRLRSFSGDGAASADDKTAGVLDQAAAMALAMKTYPRAKEFLISHGRSKSEVDAMSAAQVVVLYARDRFNRLAERHLRWRGMPFAEASTRMEKESQFLRSQEDGFDEGLPIASNLMPAFGNALAAYVRFERRLTALQAVEAIRAHAARTGKLPNSLSEIVQTPVPMDPATSAPFDYKVADGVATIRLTEGLPGPRRAGVIYQIELRSGN